MSGRVLFRAIFLALVLLCAINAVVVSATGGYDLTFGPVHIGSHSAFKAILQAEGAFLFALVAFGLIEGEKPAIASVRGGVIWPALLIAILVCAAYLPSITVHFQHHDWNHRHISADIHNWRDAAKLFVRPQGDGFYRPMTFLSLWLDYRAFGNQGWGYHLQSVAFHIVNCVLLLVLARSLGFSDTVSRWAAVLFGVAAANFEPVLWPAARFDLMATAFTLAALIFAVRYLEGGRFSAALASAGFLVLGIMNKESAYCFPLVAGCLILFWRAIKPGPIPVRRAVKLAGVVLPAIAIMILVRVAVYKGLGGYPPLPESSSPHYAFTLKTVISLFTRPPLALFGINTAVKLAPWTIAAIAVLGSVMIAAVALGARAGRVDLVLLLCALLSAVPTLNIINWIGESMQQTRYLYMPGIWLALFVASALGRRRWAAPLLALWAAANLVGLEHNVGVYRTTLQKIGVLTKRVRDDVGHTPAGRSVVISDLAEDPNGVFFGGSELMRRIQTALPGVEVRQVEKTADPGCPDLLYHWNNTATELERQAVPAHCRP